MLDLLVQIVIAGSGDDAEGWMNILFLVVLAVFWAVSGVIKAASQKSQNKPKPPPSRKPVRKKPTPASKPSSMRPASPPGEHPQPRPASPAAKLEKALRSKTKKYPHKLKSPTPQAKEKSILKDFPDFANKPYIDLEPIGLDRRRQAREAEDLPELVLDFTDPDELSKAILHYEILGPPVSLRNPSDQTNGL